MKDSVLTLFQTRYSYTAERLLRRVSLGLSAHSSLSSEPDET